MFKFALIVFLFGFVACHETRKTEAGGETSEKRIEKPEGFSAPLEKRTDDAFARANHHVERARIMSRTVEPLRESLMQGVALPFYVELPDVRWEDNLRLIRESGANSVSLVVSWDQQTIFHNRIYPDDKIVPSDARIAEVVAEAKRHDLKVMMFPILHVVRRNQGEWRGKLQPTDRERWNKDYRAYILKYAELSERSGIDVLSVGSELSSMESDTAFWTELIADVRKVYSGKLIYSANWDHYETPTFWKHLDYIGVSAYFEVAKREDEPIYVVTDRWRIHRDRIVEFAKKQQRPVLLTEVGYPSIDSAATKPWDYTAKTPPNENAQLAAYRSVVDAWSETKAEPFAGLFIWHGWGAGGPEDLSYAVWGKTSHELIKRWYGAPN